MGGVHKSARKFKAKQVDAIQNRNRMEMERSLNKKGKNDIQMVAKINEIGLKKT